MTAPAAPAAAPKGRLGNGQLRRQVAEYLADHPGPCKPGEIAKALGKSAGAVGNRPTPPPAAPAAAIAPRPPLPPKPAPAPAPSPAPKPAPPASAGPVTRPNGQ